MNGQPCAQHRGECPMIEVKAHTNGALLPAPLVKMVPRTRWEASYTADVVTAAESFLLSDGTFRADDSYLLLFLDTSPDVKTCGVLMGGIPKWWGRRLSLFTTWVFTVSSLTITCA